MKVANQTLHQQVVELIKEMIESGELRLGQKIDEITLAESFGVSRTPIREALRILNNQGVIDLVPHKGAFVRQFSIKEIDDMFQVMSILEGMCAELAAAKMTTADFKRVERLHKDLERYYEAKNHKAYNATNSKLHSLIQEIAGNAAINEVIAGLRQKVLLFRFRQLYEPERFKKSIQEHRKLLDALEKRDPKKAKAVMKAHLLAQSKALINILQKKGMEENSQQ
jgi:DNA-binding GntR family transcriptional regulator